MTLRVGQKAPEFDVVASSGERLRSADFRGRKNVILYFYPGDFTPVCTRETCGFRDAYADLEGKDAVIIGVSTHYGGLGFNAATTLCDGRTQSGSILGTAVTAVGPYFATDVITINFPEPFPKLPSRFDCAILGANGGQAWTLAGLSKDLAQVQLLGYINGGALQAIWSAS